MGKLALVLLGLGLVLAATCAEDVSTTCTECTDEGNVWIVGPRCEERCVSPPSGTMRNASVWRSSATTPEGCSTLRKCLLSLHSLSFSTQAQTQSCFFPFSPTQALLLQG